MAAHNILSKEIAYRKLQRMAYEIAEQNINEEQVILAGIKENGKIISRILYSFLKEIFKGDVKLIEIALDKRDPKYISLSEKINLDNKVIIITDDVANSGRTLLYAIKPFLDYYPKKIQTLVLVKRSHNNFPVQPDYVGLSISTTLQEHIFVEVQGNEVTGAYLQ